MGERTQLVVEAKVAEFADPIFVTGFESGTTYQSSNTSLVLVDSDGAITARAPGRAYVEAKYRGASAVTKIDVAATEVAYTSIEGFVTTGAGTAVSNAVVTTTFDGSAVTDQTGWFRIASLPFPLGATLQVGVVARDPQTGATAQAIRSGVVLVPGGVTDVGILMLEEHDFPAYWTGSSGHWGQGSNWLGGVLPSATQNAVIARELFDPNVTAYTVTLDGNDGLPIVSGIALDSPAATVVLQRSLIVNGPALLLRGRVSLSSADWGGTGSLQLRAPTEVPDGAIFRVPVSNEGPFAVVTGGTQSSALFLSGLANRGAVTVGVNSSASRATLSVSGGVLQNQAGGVIRFSSGAAGYHSFLASQAENDGEIRFEGNTRYESSFGHFINRNLVVVASPRELWSDHSGVVFTQESGELRVETGARFLFNGTGSGLFAFHGGRIDIEPVTLFNTDLTIGSQAVERARFTVCGTTRLTGDLLAAHELTVDAAACSGLAVLARSDSAPLSNGGELVFTSQAFTSAGLSLSPGAALVNERTGRILVAYGGGGDRYLSAELHNKGSLVLGTALTLGQVSDEHVNDGTIDLGINPLTIASGATSSLTNSASGSIQGSGDLRFDGGYGLINDGQLLPGGVGALGSLRCTGAFYQSPTGRISIELGSGGHDAFVIDGHAEFHPSSHVVVAFLNGTQPQVGMPFSILTFGSRGFDLPIVDLPTLPASLRWIKSWSSNALTVRIATAL